MPSRTLLLAVCDDRVQSLQNINKANSLIDLYLIRPPPEALHTAVNPSQIVICGDSAGGGTVLALLQVIRDTGLPPPAGAVLVSPWGDLTHSFPSVFENTATASLTIINVGIPV